MGSRRDRGLMVVLIVVIGILALIAAPSEENNPADGRASTFRSSPFGTRALFLVLERVGVGAERRLAPYVDADALAGPLVLLAPAESPTPAELDALRAWVEWGGTLVYAARPGDRTLEALGLELFSLAPDSLGASGLATWKGRRATPALHALVLGTEPVEGFRWAFADTSAAFLEHGADMVFSTSGGDAVVVAYGVGKGRVVAWSDAAPLRNRALRESGAALAFARMAARVTPPGEALVFDEYHHGYRGDGSPLDATLRFVREAPAGRMALQLGAAALLLLLAAGWRFGSPIPPPPARRRSPLEHVEALAGAYRQAGARATARRLLLAGMARRLGRRGPTDAAEEAELLERLGTHLPVGREAAREVRDEWKKGERADLVALSGKVDRLLSEVKRS